MSDMVGVLLGLGEDPWIWEVNITVGHHGNVITIILDNCVCCLYLRFEPDMIIVK